MSKGFITGTNEELIKAYKESRDESYLKELIEANKGLINLLVSPYLTSIPNSELEDLTSESYIPMLRAIEDYDPEQGVAFSTLLKVYVRQHLNRLYNEATRQKRFTGTTPDSLDRLSEINKESGTETDSTFEVECKDFSSVEFMDLLDSLQLNDKEQVAVNILMAGGAKGEIASGIAPIGHTVTVVSAVGKTVSIKSRITLNDGYQWSQVKPKAEETLEAYFLEMRKNWEKGNLVVRISQIENRLLNLDGILDVADTQLNDVASNLALAQEEIPLLGGVYIG